MFTVFFMLLLLFAVVNAQEDNVTQGGTEIQLDDGGEVLPSEEENVNAGITPDSFLWGIDVALDRIALALTRNPQSRAEKGLLIAQERLQELRAMADAGDLDAAMRARDEHGRALGKVEDAVGEIEEEDSAQELEDHIDLELKVHDHEEAVADLETKIKIEVNGQLTEEQWTQLLAFISDLSNQTTSVDIKIKDGKTKIKIRIGQEGKDADDVENKIEDRLGANEKEQEHAFTERDRALKKWEDFVDKSDRMNVTITNSSEFDMLIADADALLAAGDFDGAKDAYEEAKHLAQRIKQTLEEDKNENEDTGDEAENESSGKSSEARSDAPGRAKERSPSSDMGEDDSSDDSESEDGSRSGY